MTSSAGFNILSDASSATLTSVLTDLTYFPAKGACDTAFHTGLDNVLSSFLTVLSNLSVAFCALSTSLSLTPVITALRSVFNVLASDNILFASVPSLNISSPIIIIGTKAIAIFLAILSFLFRLLLSIPEFILISILTLLRFQGCVTHVSCKKPYILLFYLAIKHIYEQHYKPGYVQPSSG